jgi:hypothetical protein
MQPPSAAKALSQEREREGFMPSGGEGLSEFPEFFPRSKNHSKKT